jgi:hypothetical protein
MAAKQLPKSFRLRAVQHFNELWGNQSSMDLAELLAQVRKPPSRPRSRANLSLL